MRKQGHPASLIKMWKVMICVAFDHKLAEPPTLKYYELKKHLSVAVSPACQTYAVSTLNILTSCCDVLLWCHAVTSCHDVMTSQHRPGFSICSPKSENPAINIFLTLSPRTLTYDLDREIRPRYCQGQYVYQIKWPMSNGSAARTLTHGHTNTQTTLFL